MDWRDETRRHRKWEDAKDDARMFALVAGILIVKAVGAGILLGVVAVVATSFYRLFN